MYSIRDLEWGTVLGTGKNSKTKRGAINSLINFMIYSGEIDKSTVKETLAQKEEWIQNCRYRVFKHKHLLDSCGRSF